ncbi:MAG: hypothetical protein ABI721_05060 [Candidatus Dojkabacteria bacterium]
MRFINKIIISTFIVISFAFAPANLRAQNNVNLTISPAIINETITSGTPKEYSFKLITDVDRTLGVSMQGLSREDSSGQPIITNDLSSDFLGWFGSFDSQIIIKKDQDNIYKLSLLIPENFTGNYNFALVFRENNESSSLEDSNAAAASEIVIPFILNLKKEGEGLSEYLDVQNYRVSSTLVLNGDNSISMTLNNLGESYLIPRGVLALESVNGIGSFENKNFSVNSDKKILLSKSFLDQEFNNKFDNNYFGQVKANLTLVYGLDNTVITNQIYFWIVPQWFIMLIALIILLILSLIIFKLIRRKLK